MFHTILTLSYIIPNVYVFMRIGQLFIPKKHRLIYIAVYLLLVSVYPLSGFLSQAGTGKTAELLSSISDYLLPYFLYLFLAILATDIFILINLIFKIIPAEKLKENRIRAMGFRIVIIMPVIVLIAGIINFNTIRLTHYSIDIPARSSHIKSLRIAFASDFHLKENTGASFVRRFVSKVMEAEPDIMIYGGDIVEGDSDNGSLREAESLLRMIKPVSGVFAVLGNHEHYSGQDNGSFFRNAGIKVLSDTVIVINGSFNLAGRNDSHSRTRKSVGELMNMAVDSLPVILADHRPTDLEEAESAGVDIQVSGHTHHGQLFPINLITNMVYKLSYGHLLSGRTHFFVSSGIRLWGPPVRTTGRSEIVIIDVRFIGSR